MLLRLRFVVFILKLSFKCIHLVILLSAFAIFIIGSVSDLEFSSNYFLFECFCAFVIIFVFNITNLAFFLIFI